jgi:hypothetical protein
MSSKGMVACLVLLVLPALACSMVRIVLFDPTPTAVPVHIPTSQPTSIPHPTEPALPVNTQLPTTPPEPSSTPLPTFTPLPTKSIPLAEFLALKDTLAYMKQKGYADLQLMEVGYASSSSGKDQSYTDFVIKVKCMSGDCHTGDIFTNILPVLPTKTAPSPVTKFHIQVYTVDLKLVEDVSGNLADARNYFDGQISFDELLKKLKINLG